MERYPLLFCILLFFTLFKTNGEDLQRFRPPTFIVLPSESWIEKADSTTGNIKSVYDYLKVLNSDEELNNIVGKLTAFMSEEDLRTENPNAVLNELSELDDTLSTDTIQVSDTSRNLYSQLYNKRGISVILAIDRNVERRGVMNEITVKMTAIDALNNTTIKELESQTMIISSNWIAETIYNELRALLPEICFRIKNYIDEKQVGS